jgi:hypothetical protein
MVNSVGHRLLRVSLNILKVRGGSNLCSVLSRISEYGLWVYVHEHMNLLSDKSPVA